MVPLADGSDMGGSLRNPASFCNVAGLRPSVGRVPAWPAQAAFSQISTPGPMARTAADLALMLAAIAGPDPRSPISLETRGDAFLRPLERDFSGVRIAFDPDPSAFPVDPRVSGVLERRRPDFKDLGCAVEDAGPDFAGADEAFKTFRAWDFEMLWGELLETHRDQLKDTVVWNIEEGRKLTGPQLGRAEKLRSALYERVRRFLERYEFLVLPTSQVPPFDVKVPYVEGINGVPMRTYVDWMQSCCFVTATGLPAASVPAGFTPEGLSVGAQIVGRPRDEFGVLQLAHAFEIATGFGERRPPIV